MNTVSPAWAIAAFTAMASLQHGSYLEALSSHCAFVLSVLVLAFEHGEHKSGEQSRYQKPASLALVIAFLVCVAIRVWPLEV